MSTRSSDVKDKDGQPIHEGENVWTPIRGGEREGKVEKSVRTEAEAKEEGVKHPPKVSSSGFVWRGFGFVKMRD
jgi:hypothetical protein